MRRRYLGEMLTLRLEGGRGEDLTGSMLPTYGEDAHLQPTDAPPHPVGIQINSNMALLHY